MMRLRFKPKEDITAYEVAWLFSSVAFGSGALKRVTLPAPLPDDAPPDMMRHFEETEDWAA